MAMARLRSMQLISANSSSVTLGVAGKVGDLLTSLIIIPRDNTPGNVTLHDDGTSYALINLGTLQTIAGAGPIQLAFDVNSTAGAWKITTGANVAVLAIGVFSQT